MRSIWRVARLIPMVVVPTLWSGRYLLTNTSDAYSSDNPAQEQTTVPIIEDILVRQAEIKAVQTLKPTQQKDSQQQQNPRPQENIQSNNESATPTIVENAAIEENDPPRNIQAANPAEQQQSTQQQEDKEARKSFDVSLLQPNQVVLSASCPAHLLRYFELCNYQIIRSHSLPAVAVLRNSRNDLFTLDSAALANEFYMKTLANYIRPPRQIATVEQAKQTLKVLSRDGYVVMTYIPDQQAYQARMSQLTKSRFDEFTLSRKVDAKSLEDDYVNLAYRSSSNKNSYVILRTPEAANFFKIDPFNIAKPYLLQVSGRESGGESTFKQGGLKYKVSEVKPPLKNDRDWLNKITHRYLNKVDNQPEMEDKIRQLRMCGDRRKILLFYTQQSREDFHKKTEEILQKVARLQKQDVIVIKTSNQQVLRKVLKVEPDSFATIRLIDVHSPQQPLFGPSNPSYSRRKYKGPFRPENLCDFVSSTKWEEQYENKKKVPSIKAVKPSELLQLNNSLVLVQKEGCEGCRYVGESLEQLRKVIKGLSSGGRLRKQLIYRLGIQDPRGLEGLQLRRYSIFNDHESFRVPSTTPRLFWMNQGRWADLQVQKSLAKLNSLRSGSSPEHADELVLTDIIEKIRQQHLQSNAQL